MLALRSTYLDISTATSFVLRIARSSEVAIADGEPRRGEEFSMARRNHDVQVSPKGDGRKGWKVTQDHRVISEHNKQSTAIHSGRREAIRDRVDLTVRGRDGQIRSKDSYGNDPNPPRDTEH